MRVDLLVLLCFCVFDFVVVAVALAFYLRLSCIFTLFSICRGSMCLFRFELFLLLLFFSFSTCVDVLRVVMQFVFIYFA